MRKLLYAIVAMFTFLIGCAALAVWLSFSLYCAPKPEILPLQVSIPWRISMPDRETERYAVYSAVIRELYSRDGATLLVIRRDTGSTTFSDVDAQWRDLRASKGFAELEFDTLVAYLAADTELGSLNKQLDLPIDYALISKTELEQLFEPANLNTSWGRFNSEYQGASGIIDLSNVGFNPEMNQALLYTGFVCGDTCGSGGYALLNKEYGVWKVRSTSVIWIS